MCSHLFTKLFLLHLIYQALQYNYNLRSGERVICSLLNPKLCPTKPKDINIKLENYLCEWLDIDLGANDASNMAEVQADYYEEMFKEITKRFYYSDDEDKPDHLESSTATMSGPMSATDDEDDFQQVEGVENQNTFGDVTNGSVDTSLGADDVGVVRLTNGYESTIDVPLLSKFTLDEEENWICSDETIPWTTSKIASYSPSQKLFRCNECECVGFLSRIAEHWLGSHANLRVFQCSQCPYASAWARCVKMHLARQHHDICPEATADENFQKLMKVNPVLDEVTKYLEELKIKLEPTSEDGDCVVDDVVSANPTRVTLPTQTSPVLSATLVVTAEPLTLPTITATLAASTAPIQMTAAPIEVIPTVEVIKTTNSSTEAANLGDVYTLATIKRYNCEHCSYATDRKDLFTRHENIHREDKPFQCNVCQKQFNRADHIKKHFIRMHRDHEYVLSNVRRAKSQLRGGHSAARSREKVIQQPATMSMISHEVPESTLQAIIQRALPTTIIATAAPAATAVTVALPETHTSVIQSTNMQEFLQHSDAEPMDISFFGTHTLLLTTDVKSTTKISKPQRIKKFNIEKNVQCSYCTWTGADNWCLKRHLNTHLKPYACSMCEYKAARSERLTTHIFRVHNKRACTKCNFLADDQNQLTAHQLENHKGMKSRKKTPLPSENRTTETSTSIL